MTAILPYDRCEDVGMQLLFDGADPTRRGVLADSELVDLYDLTPPPGGLTLRTNFVSTLDGSVQGRDGRSGTINTRSDQHVFALQRALCDVVLVGAGTVRAEGYRGVDLAGWQRELRAARGLAELPTLVVVSISARVDPSVVHSEGGPVMIATSASADRDSIAELTAAGAEVVRLPSAPDGLDLPDVLELLGQRGHSRILCEGGPGLHRDLLAADLVTELALTLSPIVVGAGLRSTRGGPLATPPAFQLQTALLASDGALFTLYRRAADG
jgi:riboflavin biosynthesis pyrimidine reductase